MESIAELFEAVPVRKEFKNSKLVFKLRTLTADEITDSYKRADLLAITQETRMLIVRRYLIAYSLESINGIDVIAIPEVQKLMKTADNKPVAKEDAVAQILGTFDDSVLESLYRCYSILVEETHNNREELKKA
jgi:hypothetical protein